MSNAESEILAVFAEEELTPSRWSNAPGASYASHEHAHHKVLFCIAGSITFITADGRETLAPGDRLDLPAGTRHAAVVGPDGVTCVEAFRLP